MLFSYNWLKDYIEGRLPKADKLADILTLHSFEVEEVKKRRKDWLLDIDILPNRAHDSFSYLGVAREIALLSNLKFEEPDFLVKESKDKKTSGLLSVKVKDKLSCPRYTARVLTGVRVKSSPKKIRKRIESMGLQSINNIVDILNYVMLETGQPLHAFDFDKLEGSLRKEIVVRWAKVGERIKALDDKIYRLDSNILLISDKKGPLAIAGIKGGKKAEISGSTKNIVIESANFEMGAIRRARQKLNLQTDASLRFEHEPDPNLTILALNRAASLVKKFCGGNISQGVVDIYPKKVVPKKVKLDLDKLESVLGINIKGEKAISILKKIGISILDKKSNGLLVEIPTFRRDLSIEEDLIEEIGRVYGFEKIRPKSPYIPAIPPKDKMSVFWEDFSKNILKEIGFSEVYNYSFLSESLAKKLSLSKDLIVLENPISSETKYLRFSLIPGLLKNAKENLKNFKGVKIFELGKIYFKKGFSEKIALTGLITGSESFYFAKGIVDLLLEKLGISDFWYDEFEASPEDSKKSFWQKGKCAEIKIGNKEVGFLGEISSKLVNKMEIADKIVVFDFDFEKLQKLCSEEHEYQPISRFPSAVRDLAILIPKDEKVISVLNEINRAGGELVRDVDLFDIYEGEELPLGKKNLAFRVIYQSKDHTLTKEEIDDLQSKIINTLEENPKWEVRK